MIFSTLTGKHPFEPQNGVWSKKALGFVWELDKLKFFYKKSQLWKILMCLGTLSTVAAPKVGQG